MGLPATRPFTDNAIATRERGAGMVGISEYGGIQGWQTPMAMPDLPREETTASRIAGALSDGMRRLAGRPTDAEVKQAERIQSDARYFGRIDQDAAARVADHLIDQPEASVRRVLPNLAPGPLNAEPALRWVQIGGAALDAVHEHVDHGADDRLSAPIGRAARLASLEDLATVDRDRPLVESLGRMSRLHSDQVRNYLSVGPAIDDARARQALSVRNAHGRTAEELEWEMASARAGMVAPHEIVSRADDFAKGGSLPRNHVDGHPVPMPDLATRHKMAVQQREAVDRQIEIGRAASGRLPTHPLLAEMAVHARVLANAPSVSRQQTARAPVALTERTLDHIAHLRNQSGLDPQAGAEAARLPRARRSELAHRFMALMVADAVTNHPEAARTLVAHADTVQRNASPEANEERGIGRGTSSGDVRRLTVIAEAQRHVERLDRDPSLHHHHRQAIYEGVVPRAPQAAPAQSPALAAGIAARAAAMSR